MAGKNNAKSAKQTEPAADAAMAETVGGTVEQAVTPFLPEGEAVPGMTLHVNGKTITESGVSEQPAPLAGSNPYELEPICTIGPEDLEQFSVAVFEAVASLIAGAGFLIRQGSEQAAPFGKDILAASFRQDGSITAATADGRKFILKNGEVNEA